MDRFSHWDGTGHETKSIVLWYALKKWVNNYWLRLISTTDEKLLELLSPIKKHTY